MPYPTFDRSRLKLKPLSERRHDMNISDLLKVEEIPIPFENPDLLSVSERVISARRKGCQVIFMMGAHLLKAGLCRQIIDLMDRGFITHIGMNGAGPIHDFETALVGATTEKVARYIQTGEFGLWEETGRINEAAKLGQREGIGLGEAIGRMIQEDGFPHRDLSLLAAGFRLRIPITVHIGIGYDIIHEHPNCDGAATGDTSYRDFLVFTQTVSQLEGGVFLNIGSSVMGPEVYLKALSMARNVARQEGRDIKRFTTAVFDIISLDGDYRVEAPKTDPRYYFRPYKTILVRTVQDGGESFYIQGDLRATFPNLYRQILSVDRLS